MSAWPELLRLAALRFAIPPEAFWRLSLAEWRALTAQPTHNRLSRAGLDDLLTLYPDEAP